MKQNKMSLVSSLLPEAQNRDMKKGESVRNNKTIKPDIKVD